MHQTFSLTKIAQTQVAAHQVRMIQLCMTQFGIRLLIQTMGFTHLFLQLFQQIAQNKQNKLMFHQLNWTRYFIAN